MATALSLGSTPRVLITANWLRQYRASGPNGSALGRRPPVLRRGPKVLNSITALRINGPRLRTIKAGRWIPVALLGVVNQPLDVGLNEPRPTTFASARSGDRWPAAQVSIDHQLIGGSSGVAGVRQLPSSTRDGIRIHSRLMDFNADPESSGPRG
jgi:hypothetical protein